MCLVCGQYGFDPLYPTWFPELSKCDLGTKPRGSPENHQLWLKISKQTKNQKTFWKEGKSVDLCEKHIQKGQRYSDIV